MWLIIDKILLKLTCIRTEVNFTCVSLDHVSFYTTKGGYQKNYLVLMSSLMNCINMLKEIIKVMQMFLRNYIFSLNTIIVMI